MFKVATAPRSNVTVDDRRAVFMAAWGRKPRDILAVPNEVFIRNMLKDRMGWPHREPAPESIKAVTREMVESFKVAANAAAKVAADKAAAQKVEQPVEATA